MGRATASPLSAEEGPAQARALHLQQNLQRREGHSVTTAVYPWAGHPLQELSLAREPDQKASEVSWGLQHLWSRQYSVLPSVTFTANP